MSYKIKNVGSGKYLNISGGTNMSTLSINQNVTQYQDSGTNEQLWEVDFFSQDPSGLTGSYIMSTIARFITGQANCLNIFRSTKNCDVFPINSNSGGDGYVYFEPTGTTDRYRIITKSNFSTTKHYLSLATNNSNNNTNVCWAPYDGTNYQVWAFETVRLYTIVNGWLRLYQDPTVSGSGRTVTVSSDKPSGWDARENLSPGSNAGTHSVYKGSKGE